jgi:serine/threonine protein kinase
MSATIDPGARLGGGRYVVKGLLGQGSQGTTYEATDAQGNPVAIKRFDVRGARSWKDVELAEREARVLSTLDHPLMPRYLENFEEDGALYLVMTKVEGETLEAMRKREPVSETEVRRFLACADRALTYLHGRSSRVVHRDLKPGNVVRRSDGTYVLVDFGAVSESLVRRGSSTIVGTIGYMAPEQLQGRALPSSDVYAVGATALAALTGKDPETLPHRGLRVDVRTAAGGRASPELLDALERMLEPDPDVRAQSIGAALEAAATRAPAVVPATHAAPVAAAALYASGPPSSLGFSNEDALVKSLRRLLWMLWGIGWVVVPLIIDPLLHLPGELIPLVMFGWLALNLIAGWHKGALLRAVIRQWSPPRAMTGAAGGVRVGEATPVQVRVASPELRPEEVVARTDVQTADDARRRESGR